MRNPSLPGIVLILLVILSGCTSVKRFKSATFRGQDDSLADMALFGASLDQTGEEKACKNLWDLSAGAQTQLIQILNDRYPDNEQFTGALNREYTQKGTEEMTDFTTRNLRMVFTISKKREYSSINEGAGRYSPADRIEYLTFSLEIPPESNLRFTGWNHYTTEYGELEIADVSFSRSLDLEAEFSDEKTSGIAKGSLNRKEEQLIKARYLKLNGSISDHKLVVEEEGTRGIDLTGNVIADVSLEFDGFPERITTPLYCDNESGSRSVVSALTFEDVSVPRMENAPEEIMATLVMEYVYRHVQAGWKTFQEWDDRVAYYSGRISKQVPLFERQDYIPALYCLGSDKNVKKAVKVRTGTWQEYPLQFMNYAEASRFFNWLVRESASKEGDLHAPVLIGENLLLFENQPLTWDMVENGVPLKVMPVYLN